jgi:hypothetical protein
MTQTLDQHPGVKIIKALIVGHPGAGKTGALTSLVKAGYKLRILDFDNLLSTLVSFVLKECPQNAKNVAYQTFTDLFMAGQVDGKLRTAGAPKAYAEAMKVLNNWPGLGVPATWDADTFVVIDSLTSMSKAAHRWADALNPVGKSGQKDDRAAYFSAQNMIMDTLDLLNGVTFLPNVLVLAHIKYDVDQLNVTRGFPRTVGSALNDIVGANFNSVLMIETKQSTTGLTRVIRTQTTGIVDLKNPLPFVLPAELPISTGLADFVSAVRNHGKLAQTT